MNVLDIQIFLMDRIKSTYPKLFITKMVDNQIKFKPENDIGYIEYKRTLIDCNIIKMQKYASQMRWRISENIKHQFATYYIGIDDDGSIVGLNNDEAFECVKNFVSITELIKASITEIQIINIYNSLIMKINVKIKKNINNYLSDFNEFE